MCPRARQRGACGSSSSLLPRRKPEGELQPPKGGPHRRAPWPIFVTFASGAEGCRCAGHSTRTSWRQEVRGEGCVARAAARRRAPTEHQQRKRWRWRELRRRVPRRQRRGRFARATPYWLQELPRPLRQRLLPTAPQRCCRRGCNGRAHAGVLWRARRRWLGPLARVPCTRATLACTSEHG